MAPVSIGFTVPLGLFYRSNYTTPYEKLGLWTFNSNDPLLTLLSPLAYLHQYYEGITQSPNAREVRAPNIISSLNSQGACSDGSDVWRECCKKEWKNRYTTRNLKNDDDDVRSAIKSSLILHNLLYVDFDTLSTRHRKSRHEDIVIVVSVWPHSRSLLH